MIVHAASRHLGPFPSTFGSHCRHFTPALSFKPLPLQKCRGHPHLACQAASQRLASYGHEAGAGKRGSLQAGCPLGRRRPNAAKARGGRPRHHQTLAGPAPGSVANSSVATGLAFALGYVVFAVACVRGIPQIVKILRAGSAEGVSLLSVVVETLCYTVVFFYHARHAYPFLAYGELGVLLLQNSVLIALILYYTKRLTSWKTGVGVAAYTGFVWGLATGFIPMRLLTCATHVALVMQASVIFVIGLGSRVPQIWMNIRRGDSGQLSSTTCLINLSGNLTRLFTTVVLMGDRLVLASNISQGILNSILLYQTVMTKVRSRSSGPASANAQPAPST